MRPPFREQLLALRLRRSHQDIRATLPLPLATGYALAGTALYLLRRAAALADRGFITIDPLPFDDILRVELGCELNDAIAAGWVIHFLLSLDRVQEALALARDPVRHLPTAGGDSIAVLDGKRFKRVASLEGRAWLTHAARLDREAIAFLTKLQGGGNQLFRSRHRATGFGPANQFDVEYWIGRLVRRVGFCDQTGEPLHVTPTILRKTGVAMLLDAGALGQSIQRQLKHNPGSAALRLAYFLYAPEDREARMLERFVPISSIYGFGRYGSR
jgi:integrase